MTVRFAFAALTLFFVHQLAFAQGSQPSGTPGAVVPANRLGDYIPCQFTTAQEDTWRQEPRLATLAEMRGAIVTKVAEIESAKVEIQAKLDVSGEGAQKTELQSQRNELETQRAALSSLIPLVANAKTAADARGAIETSKLPAQVKKEIKEGGPGNKIVPPDDVSCSQSLFSVREASDVFGRRIAKTYVAVQVVVRNLSKDFEFIVHDVQVAAPGGHFRAGRDKMLARGVAQKGASIDPRNQIMSGLDWLSVGAQGALSFASQDFKLGTGIFGVLLPPLKRWFPDNTVDQLQRLSDMGFTSSTASKIVVPKSGSVPFVTFIPDELFRKSPSTWTRDDFLGEQNLLSVIVAGVHVQEVNKDTPVLSDMQCPPFTGNLDLTQNPMVCTLKGQNLNLIDKLRLKSPDSADTKDAVIKITNQNGQEATATFQQKDLQALAAPAYTAYLEIVKDGEQRTNFTFKLPNPNVLGIDPPQLDTSSACKVPTSGTEATCEISVVGTSLKGLDKLGLALKDGDTTTSIECSSFTTSSEIKGTCSLVASKLAKGTTYFVVGIPTNKRAPVVTHQKIEVK